MGKNKYNNSNIDVGGAKNAFKTVSMMIFATAFSKVLGLLRVVFMAHYYGDSAEGAAFLTASRIPLTFFDLLLGAAVLGVFIPIYNSISVSSEDDADIFADIFINAVFLITLIFSFAGILFSEQIIRVAAPGYQGEMLQLASELLKILFPMMVFTGAVYTFVGILQSKNNFLVPAFVSAVSNLGIILYFLTLNKYFGIHGLACAYLLSWMVQLVTLLIPLYKKRRQYKFKYRPILNLKNSGLRRAVKMSVPIMAGAWLVPAAMLIGHKYSSITAYSNRAVSAFEYSTQLFLLITGILTYGICNFIFPKLSRISGEKDADEFNNMVKNGLSVSFFVIIPISVIAFVLRDEIIAVIFPSGGMFTDELSNLVSAMFAALVPAMIFYSGTETLNRVFYAKNMVKIPMIAAGAGILVNDILCRLFIGSLQLSPFYVALSFACSIFTAFAILFISALKCFKGALNRQFYLNFCKTSLSAGASFAAIYGLHSLLKNIVTLHGFMLNFIVAGGFSLIALALYLCVNLLLRTLETTILVGILKSKNSELP